MSRFADRLLQRNQRDFYVFEDGKGGYPLSDSPNPAIFRSREIRHISFAAGIRSGQRGYTVWLVSCLSH